MTRRFYRARSLVALAGALEGARVTRGLTQDGLARAIGSSRPTISRMERGRPAHTETLLAALAECEYELVVVPPPGCGRDGDDVTGALHLWLHGQHLGEIDQLRNGRLRLRYDTAALDTYGLGARPLSLSLPLTDKRVQGDVLERFLDNLLPEGSVRGALEREHRIRPGDTFALLTRIGRECAGAIQLTADAAAPGDGSWSISRRPRRTGSCRACRLWTRRRGR